MFWGYHHLRKHPPCYVGLVYQRHLSVTGLPEGLSVLRHAWAIQLPHGPKITSSGPSFAPWLVRHKSPHPNKGGIYTVIIEKVDLDSTVPTYWFIRTLNLVFEPPLTKLPFGITNPSILTLIVFGAGLKRATICLVDDLKIRVILNQLIENIWKYNPSLPNTLSVGIPTSKHRQRQCL